MQSMLHSPSSPLAIGNRHRRLMSPAPPSVSGNSEATGLPDAMTMTTAITKAGALGRSTIGGVGIPIPTEAAVAATTAETTTVETENANVHSLGMTRRHGLSASHRAVNWTKVMTVNGVIILARGRENGDRHLVRDRRMKRTRRRKSENVRSYNLPRTISRCCFKSKRRLWKICSRSEKLSSDESEWTFTYV